MRIAGSLPRLPQRLMVRVETRRMVATSETVSRSGRLFRSRSFLTGLVIGVWSWLSMSDIEINRTLEKSQGGVGVKNRFFVLKIQSILRCSALFICLVC